MYYVIFYDDWCSVVPNNWVDIDKKVFYWPPKEINVTVKTLTKKIPPNHNWTIQIYRRILGPYSNYNSNILKYILLVYKIKYLLSSLETFKDAREMEIEAVNVSTSDEAQFKILNENTGIQMPQKRLTKPKRFYGDTDDDNSNYLS